MSGGGGSPGAPGFPNTPNCIGAPVVELAGTSRTYHMGEEVVAALDAVDFRVERGEYWSVMGPSGSGKSTLLNVLGCLDRPTEGTYVLAGRDTGLLDDDDLSELRSRSIGFIFQSYNLIPQLDVLENVLVPLFYQNPPPRNGEERGRALADRLGLGDRLGHRPSELSGGQQQRVAIARALVNDPDLILADEATGNLDSHTAEEILGLFDELSAEGKTIVFVTHEPAVAARGTHILRMRDGRVEEVIAQRAAAGAPGKGDLP